MIEVAGPLTGKRAVIVEDEGITVLQLTKVLRAAGMGVVGTVGTGEDAIHTVLRERPDLVLMDITMPGEINGLDAAEAILAQFPVCIVLVTAYADEQYRVRAADLNACGYLVKPVVAATLIPELEMAVEQWAQAGT